MHSVFSWRYNSAFREVFKRVFSEVTNKLSWPLPYLILITYLNKWFWTFWDILTSLIMWQSGFIFFISVIKSSVKQRYRVPWKCTSGGPGLWRNVRKGFLKKVNSRWILKVEDILDSKSWGRNRLWLLGRTKINSVQLNEYRQWGHWIILATDWEVSMKKVTYSLSEFNWQYLVSYVIKCMYMYLHVPNEVHIENYLIL